MMMLSSLRRSIGLVKPCLRACCATPRAYSKAIYESPNEVVVPDLTIPEMVWQNIDRYPDHTALVCSMTGRSYTYAQARMMSRNFATSLLDAGFKPGNVIALVLPNIPEYAIALLGALEAGLVVSTINPIYNTEEIRNQLADSGSKVVVTYPDRVPIVEAAAEAAVGGGLPIVVIGGGGSGPGARSFAEMIMTSSSTKTPQVSNKELAVLPYSSGTTGLPKGVRLTHRNIVANTTQISHPSVSFVLETSKDYQEVVPCVLPFFHIYGMTATMITSLSWGCKIVTLPRFEPESYIKTLITHKATLLYVVPPLVQFLSSHPAVTKAHLDHVKATVNGAAAVSLADAERFLTKKDCIFVSGYGLTESSPVITTPNIEKRNLQTVGSPVACTTIKLLDIETGEVVDHGKTGEICVKGPQIMQGYHRNEKATKETLKDGWLHTGDVGYFGADGEMYIVDRIKELIKVKGFQVAPLELEDLIMTHPKVQDVGVVGKPDSRFGEVPVAFVVAKPGTTPPTTNEIKEFVASKVSEYKQLDSVVFVPSIPKNVTGKILRKDLKATFAKA